MPHRTSPPTNSPTWFTTLSNLCVRSGARLIGGNFGRAPAPPDAALRGTGPERGHVDADGVRLGYLRWPDPPARSAPPDPPLVLLHGLDANPWMWARTAGQLAAGRCVIALALRGHGWSDTPAEGYALEDTTRDVLAALDRLTDGPVVLAGHSWGGKVAQHVAAAAPERFHALVLADPVGPEGLSPIIRRFPVLMEAALAHERQTFPDAAAHERAAARVVFLRARDETDRAVWREMFREQPDGSWTPRVPDSVFRAILRGALETDISAEVARITCPTLLLLPDFSVSPLRRDRRSFRRIPRLTVEKVRGDHSFIHSNAIDTAAAIARFLEDPGAP